MNNLIAVKVSVFESGGHAGLFPVSGHLLALHFAAAVLAAHGKLRNLVSWDRADGAQHIGLLIANLFIFKGNRRLHGHQAEHLQKVVLHHVAQRAGAFVVGPTMPDPIFFCHGDLDVFNVAPVPNGLEQRVSEPKRQDVLHGLFTQVVIDAEDLGFFESRPYHLVQLAG